MRIRYSAAEDGRPVKKAIVYTREEHGIQASDVDYDAVRIVERLKNAGHECYIVGGAVRDLIIGKKPKDFDIVTDATPSRIKKLFRNCRIIGRRFRLAHVFFGPKIFEVSTFRSLKDGTSSNTYGSIEEDVQRRDYTLNALFYDPHEQIVVDYVNGLKDIQNKYIRPIIPMDIIFKDDPVRMIRAAKYAATTGFKIPFRLAWKIRKQAALLEPVSHSRLTEELFKIIHSTHAFDIIQNLRSLHLFHYLQPDADKHMNENSRFERLYMESMKQLDKVPRKKEPASGLLLSFMIRDYLDEIINRGGEPSELYRSTLLLCRNFVIPMNPPRVELESAVRLLFREHGFPVKKSRMYEKGKRREQTSEKDRPLQERGQSGLAEAQKDGAVKKKRRRKRRRSNAVKEHDSITNKTVQTN